ncbi:uncharacterized protein isoform X2 [Salmo salar]|uniref:Uncharacterized protein LOC123732662 isoform X1 n=1 Tax=Salmo salar TaxID=8030 RepID=A0ABM3EA39_SALSA|nr:uncharacterized protein LOC123732662 isoform X1 [Salmo salar]XP_045567884.1 uncharacterized protein LOC123732662 isoform X2 [Salmo salar]XP_045568336.1 uncharacterized protein LOC123733070 isoform X1 [Salmo salar]XP_045568337.1 uncharacterized protein LOC123733070 isoform X1 [Salmo salar]XP_045568338.1 uncharacterized protein LOC123733070 isoform X2 [Salmo salar]
MQRENRREKMETYYRGEHKNIETLKMVKTPQSYRRLILKDIPLYPKADKAEFHVDKVCHVTTPTGLTGIMDLSGFTAGQRGSFSWWALHITEGEIEAAENRFLEKEQLSFDPKMGEEKRHNPFLREFTTSPVFQQGSRYGNFKFTFPLEDLMQMYTEQICEGEKPVLRVYETVVYKQEIMYVVVLHSPEVTEFDDCPLLADEDDEAICIYKDGKIVWRAEAICGTHTKKLIINRESGTVETEELGHGYEHFMWDNVTLAFHLPVDSTLVVEEGVLKDRLHACEGIAPFLHDELLTLEEAKEVVNAIKNAI